MSAEAGRAAVPEGRVEVAVVGAGAAGLAAARTLEAQGHEVLLVDAAPRVGGVMQTVSAEGFVFERGPNTFRVHAAALAVLRAAGLEAALLRASLASRVRHLFADGRLVPVPLGPAALATTPLLSPGARLRLLREPFVRRGDATGETVAAFLARRVGPEVVERLVGPFLVGVYAGDERRLGAEAVFPTLVAWERERGSLAAGGLVHALRGGPRGLPGTWSTRTGMEGLATHLARGLHGPRALGSRVRRIQRTEEGFALAVDDAGGARELRARAVVLATDAPAAAELLAGLDVEASRLAAGVDYASLVSVSLDVDPADASRALEGFGFLVPREAGLDLLGALFPSRLFPGRAPEGRVLVTALIGGVRWPEAVHAGDDVLHERVAEGLARTVGLRGGGRVLGLARWPRAVPQPSPEHPRRIAALRARLRDLGPLVLAGGWLDGVSVSDTLASGARAAESLEALRRGA